MLGMYIVSEKSKSLAKEWTWNSGVESELFYSENIVFHPLDEAVNWWAMFISNRDILTPVLSKRYSNE